MAFRDAKHLALGEHLVNYVVQCIGKVLGSFIKKVAGIEAVLLGKLVVHPDREIVFDNGLSTRSVVGRKVSGGYRIPREGIQRQERDNVRIRRDYIAIRKDSVTCICRRDPDGRRLALGLANSFVISKNKCLIL